MDLTMNNMEYMDTAEHHPARPGYFAERWWCAQTAKDVKAGPNQEGWGRKWWTALGGSLVLLTVLGLAITNHIKRDSLPTIWDHGGSLVWNVTSA